MGFRTRTPETFSCTGIHAGPRTFLALRRGLEVNAAAVIGAVFDAAGIATRPPEAFAAVTRMIPDYDTRGEETLRERSVVHWVEELDTPILILHGMADEDVPATDAVDFALRVDEFGVPYGLFVYPYDNHPVLLHRQDRIGVCSRGSDDT